jgi:hypothetical protein
MNTISEPKMDEVELNPMRQQTMNFSADYSNLYIEQHQIANRGLTSDEAKIIACARLEWIFQMVRPALSEKFSEDDFVVLLDCYRADLFFPDQFNSLASDLCDHLGIDLDDYASSDSKGLIDKLRGLEPVQKVAMADALEQLWHRGLKSGLSIPEFLETIGIQLT